MKGSKQDRRGKRWSGRYDPMLTVVSDSADRDGSGAARSAASSVIDEIVREGARRMLAEALRAEVDAYIAQFADVRDEKGHRLVVRNGCHESRTVTTSAGAVDVTAPRVNDKRVDPDTGERQRFSSSILPRWARKTPKIGEVLPLLYLHGLSSGDFVPALGQFLGSAKGLSASTIAKLTETWKAEQQIIVQVPVHLAVFTINLALDGFDANSQCRRHLRWCAARTTRSCWACGPAGIDIRALLWLRIALRPPPRVLRVHASGSFESVHQEH
jgi:hypothetical protein